MLKVENPLGASDTNLSTITVLAPPYRYSS